MSVLSWLLCTITLVGSGITIGQALPSRGVPIFKLKAAMLMGLGIAFTAAQQLAPISEFIKGAMAILGLVLVLIAVAYRLAKGKPIAGVSSPKN